MSCLSDAWLVLTHPSCWIRIYPTDLDWDRELNYLMSKHSFTDFSDTAHVDGKYDAAIGGVVVWIKNHPYASFRRRPGAVLPRRSTTLRAWKKLQEDAKDWQLEKLRRTVVGLEERVNYLLTTNKSTKRKRK